MARIRGLLGTSIGTYIIKNKPAAVHKCVEQLRPGEAGISAVTKVGASLKIWQRFWTSLLG
jgi:hypothetical protein